MALGGLLPTVFPQRVFGAKPATPNKPAILVLVQLAGGNDGLNTLIPYDDDRYYRLRPTIAIPRDETLAITDGLALHPACGGLERLYQGGNLAIVQGVGYANPNRSHFGSEAIWANAEYSERIHATGWLGRYMDGHAAEIALRPEPMAAHFSLRTPECLRGEEANLIYGFEAEQEDSLSPYHQRIVNTVKSYRPSALYPGTRFGTNLQKIAALISARYTTRIYHLTLGGFDTHHSQTIPHHNLLADLSNGLAAFQDDLFQQGQDPSVLTMTYSEFGRRPGENERHGTDHGTSAPMFIIGRMVTGGIYGESPTLPANRYEDMDYHVDFRTVYGTVLDNWLGIPSQRILGHKSETLDFIRSG
jgi:uncharacterized protein (DUF1501 family)